jgi:hypothetical protein
VQVLEEEWGAVAVDLVSAPPGPASLGEWVQGLCHRHDMILVRGTGGAVGAALRGAECLSGKRWHARKGVIVEQGAPEEGPEVLGQYSLVITGKALVGAENRTWPHPSRVVVLPAGLGEEGGEGGELTPAL